MTDVDWSVIEAVGKLMDEQEIPTKGRRVHMTREQCLSLCEYSSKNPPEDVVQSEPGTIFEFALNDEALT